eukprot:INCI2991.1.p1 GENE.INCI2991.1~~INCI2991.1.p1  ORF type:complete len:749 (-),score=195.21 INCI2991.1:1721-3868(-)
MPITGTFTWKQTPLYIHLAIPLKGTSPKDVDVYVSRLYVKVNFSPYLTEIDLLHPVYDESAAQAAVVRNGELCIRLKKMQPASWPSLQVPDDMDKRERRERRARDVEEKRLRDIAAKEDAQSKRSENERRAVRVQMKVDEGEHSTMDSLKEEEKRKAEEETYRVLEGLQRQQGERVQKQKPPRSQASASSADVPLTAESGGGGGGMPTPRSEELTESAAPAAAKPAPADDDDIDDTDIMLDLAEQARREEAQRQREAEWTAQKKRDAETEIWPEEADQQVPEPLRVADGAQASGAAGVDHGAPAGDQLNEEEEEEEDLVFVPQPRQTGGVVKVGFTKRFFKTPLRESKRAEEEDWIAKNQRGLSNHPDARDIAERDPFWLKGKGDDFFKARDYHGAINAYSAALQAQPTMFAALSNRAAASLALRRFDEAVADASAALEVVQSETESRARCVKLWVRRGTALCGKGQYEAALEDYARAQLELRAQHERRARDQQAQGGAPPPAFREDPKLSSDVRTIKRLQQCAKLKREADELFRAQQGEPEKLSPAIERYTDALEVDSGFVSCYTNRAAARLAARDFLGCASDASAALVLLGVEQAGDDRNANESTASNDAGSDSAHAAAAQQGPKLVAGACTGPVPAEGTEKYAAWVVNAYVKRGVARAQLGQLESAALDYEAALAVQPPAKNHDQLRKDLSRLRKRIKKQQQQRESGGQEVN